MKYSLFLPVSEILVKREFIAPRSETEPKLVLMYTAPIKSDGMATDTDPQAEYAFNAKGSAVAVFWKMIG